MPALGRTCAVQPKAMVVGVSRKTDAVPVLTVSREPYKAIVPSGITVAVQAELPAVLAVLMAVTMSARTSSAVSVTN